MVTVVDTWNPTGRRSPNEVDDTQADICMHSGSFSDGRITCRYTYKLYSIVSFALHDYMIDYVLAGTVYACIVFAGLCHFVLLFR